MSATRVHPTPHHVYTLREVYESLLLDGSPWLGFFARGALQSVQTSHMTAEELLSVPGFADTRWAYVRTTSEQVPVFRYVSSPDMQTMFNFVDMTEYKDSATGEWLAWVTPKGFPREAPFA